MIKANLGKIFSQIGEQVLSAFWIMKRTSDYGNISKQYMIFLVTNLQNTTKSEKVLICLNSVPKQDNFVTFISVVL